MTLTTFDFREKVADTSTGRAGFSLHDGKASMTLQLFINRTQTRDAGGNPVQQELNPDSEVFPIDLLNVPQTILGGPSTNISDGRIQRLLPMAHPQFPWLYASEITGVRGVGSPVKVASITPLEAAPMPYFTLYGLYEFDVSFTTRNYAVLDDTGIELIPDNWTDQYGNLNAAIYATEWSRYTEYFIQPQNDWVTCTIGSGFTFQTQGGTGSRNTDPGTNGGAPFEAMPRILLPNEVVRFVWHEVPYRYYSSPNSYLRKFRGYINQFDWYDWKAGELLYVSCNPIRYTPPILQPYQWLFGSTTIEKWATMEIIFLSTRRQGNNLPTSLSNENFVAAGHNLMPWHADRKFYYVASKTEPFAPTFYSFPAELLWTDPDAP